MKEGLTLFGLPVWYADIIKSVLSLSHSKSALVDLIPHFELSEWATIVAPPLLYFTYGSLYYCLSLLRLTSIEIHRIPTDQPGRRPNKVTVEKVVRACTFTLSMQMCTAIALTYLTRPENISERRAESWPVVAMKLAAAMFILDTYEYWVHRWFHENRFLYRTIHSVHHELTAPFAFGALYNHPIESFCMDIIGSGLTSVILDMHPWTAALFYCISTLKTVDDHCGYTFPWHPLHIIFPNNAKFHDIHHWGKGVRYNYSQPFFTWWDHWMGTEFEAAMARKRLLDPKFRSGSEDDEEHEADVNALLKSLEDEKKQTTESDLRQRVQKTGLSENILDKAAAIKSSVELRQF